VFRRTAILKFKLTKRMGISAFVFIIFTQECKRKTAVNILVFLSYVSIMIFMVSEERTGKRLKYLVVTLLPAAKL
jgi:hypothetical protein